MIQSDFCVELCIGVFESGRRVTIASSVIWKQSNIFHKVSLGLNLTFHLSFLIGVLIETVKSFSSYTYITTISIEPNVCNSFLRVFVWAILLQSYSLKSPWNLQDHICDPHFLFFHSTHIQRPSWKTLLVEIFHTTKIFQSARYFDKVSRCCCKTVHAETWLCFSKDNLLLYLRHLGTRGLHLVEGKHFIFLNFVFELCTCFLF